MQFEPLKLPGTYKIELAPKYDARGYFSRVFDEAIMREHGLVTEWVQENQAFSAQKGTLRGLHFLLPPHTETKLLRVVAGRLLTVWVDLRKESPTFGQWDSLELDAAHPTLAYIPKGVANSICTLTDNVTLCYRVDSAYAPAFDAGIRWNDPTLNIDWPVDDPILSERDRELPFFSEFESPF